MHELTIALIIFCAFWVLMVCICVYGFVIDWIKNDNVSCYRKRSAEVVYARRF